METKTESSLATTQRIVFYDGECGFCNQSVAKLIRSDHSRVLHYAPLQGTTAQQLLPPELRNTENLGTMVYIDSHGELHTKSNAALAISAELDWPYRLFAVFKICPQSFRNTVYDFVARRRHRLAFKQACPLPTAEDALLFLP